MFDKSERSTFKYWFAHWCSFQMTALNLKCWKFKYLFHDFEKPWLLYWYMWIRRMSHEDAYKKVQYYHRTHSSHHLQYKGKKKDYVAMMIDWECSRFTKTNSPRNCYNEWLRKCMDNEIGDLDREGLSKVMEEYGLIEE